MNNIDLHNHNEHNTAEAGLDIGALRKVWRRSATAASQLHLIRTLVSLNLAFTDIEVFIETQMGKLKSDKFKGKFQNSRNKQQSNYIMNFKLSDAEQENREAVKEKTEKIKRLRSVYDRKSFKRILNRLWKETRVLRSELRDHNDQKIAWLREKYQDQRVEFRLPEDLTEYRDVNIFSFSHQNLKQLSPVDCLT